ncbi:M16 family metallopeptidase [Massilibacterium senegalense]|uniref:M16 family metallopeptidase n=1 Tax=Massilibacterium senegalense TaxID=1632858 RepID=UPI000785499D|nr:pitrilysin family protein [Massilibacterium senegalense]
MIIKHTCTNGVRVIIEPITTVRSVAIGVWVGTGSRYEELQNNGISHFLEHMFFKGTKKRSAKEIAESFDSVGGQVNAFTSKEYTCYYAKVLDTHKSMALDVLADMFFESTFIEVELEKEKNVVLEEIKMYEDTPDDIVHDCISQASFGTHPLGYPILGTKETVKSFTRDDLFAYKEQMYSPDAVVISVAGNVDESFIREIESYFGHFTSQNHEKASEKPIFLFDTKAKKKTTEQAHLCIGFEGLPVGHERLYDLAILNNILGGSMSSRLFQGVREERGLAYSIFSYHSSYQDQGLLTIYGGTGSDQLEKLYAVILKEIEDLKHHGVTEKEVMNSKEQLKGNLMLGLESTNSRMSRNGKNELLLKRHRSLDEIITQIDAVTLSSVNMLAKDLFDQSFSRALISPKATFPVDKN